MKYCSIILWMGVCNALQNCPYQWSTGPIYKDLVVLADVVSWDTGYENVSGLHSNYHCIYEKEGWYDTRMRMYNSEHNETIITFRPTQSTNEGGEIHADRYLSECIFLENRCKGNVHHRFQQAFCSLIRDAPLSSMSTFYIVGHSLGGSLALFMALYALYVLEKTPDTVIGIAGPFIGDEQFAYLYNLLFEESDWFQVQSVNKNDPSEYDGTVKDYNVERPPYIYIDEEKICTVDVPKLSDSYGMHDLRNYALFFQGT